MELILVALPDGVVCDGLQQVEVVERVGEPFGLRSGTSLYQRYSSLVQERRKSSPVKAEPVDRSCPCEERALRGEIRARRKTPGVKGRPLGLPLPLLSTAAATPTTTHAASSHSATAAKPSYCNTHDRLLLGIFRADSCTTRGTSGRYVGALSDEFRLYSVKPGGGWKPPNSFGHEPRELDRLEIGIAVADRLQSDRQLCFPGRSGTRSRADSCRSRARPRTAVENTAARRRRRAACGRDTGRADARTRRRRDRTQQDVPLAKNSRHASRSCVRSSSSCSQSRCVSSLADPSLHSAVCDTPTPRVRHANADAPGPTRSRRARRVDRRGTDSDRRFPAARAPPHRWTKTRRGTRAAPSATPAASTVTA